MTRTMRQAALAAMVVTLAGSASAQQATRPQAATSQAATSQSAGAVEEEARALIELLAAEQFEQALERFDPAVRPLGSASKLANDWRTITATTGPLQRIVSTRVRRVAGYRAVYVTCQFERQQLDFEVVYGSAGAAMGLHPVPTAPASQAAAPPPYADPKAFGEQSVQVGAESWPLPGTLTLPVRTDPNAPPVPAVVLVHGSGPHDRDETIGPNKPFRDLAWGLATRGVAVLRYEKRTHQHQARLSAVARTFTVREEVVDDAVSAVRRLQEVEGVDGRRVFILGHSFGGTLAPRIARQAPEAAGAIILAGGTRHLADAVLQQIQAGMEAKGTLSIDQQQQLKLLTWQVQTAKSPALTIDTPPHDLPLGVPAAYWIDLRDYDPAATARLVDRPILIIHGGRDYQVIQADLDGWKAGLSDRPNVQFKVYPALNHLMVAGEGRATPDEYGQPGHVDPQVVRDIAEWVHAQSAR